MGSLSQRQAIISWTLMLSLKFSLMLIPNCSCQLYTWLQVTTAALARRLCWYGCIDRWMDEKKERLRALIGLGIIERSPDLFFLFWLCIRWCCCGMAARMQWLKEDVRQWTLTGRETRQQMISDLPPICLNPQWGTPNLHLPPLPAITEWILSQ